MSPVALRAVPVTIRGTASSVTVDGTRYGLPANVTTRRVSRYGGQLAYVLTAHGALHVLGRTGEIVTPEPIRMLIVRKYFPEQAGTANKILTP